MTDSRKYILQPLFPALCSILVLSGLPSKAQTVYPEDTVLDTTLLELPSLSSEDHLIIHNGYISCFNPETLSPRWVAYELTSEELDSTATKRDGSFKKDPSYPGCQATNQDYSKSGYDKGHLAPAADFKWSVTAMAESFYFTNISPQTPALNRRHWLKLEDISRAAARAHGQVWIISGPIFREDNMEFRTIGKNKVAVPDFFFKALLAMNEEDSYTSVAFILRNDTSSQSPKESVVTVDSLETILNIDLFRALDKEISQASESTANLTFWTFD